MMRKLKIISGLLPEISFVAITWNPESNCTCREKNHSYSAEVHRRFQKYTYINGCIVGENIDDHWNVDGERNLSDAWTSFTTFNLLNERPRDGHTRSRGCKPQMTRGQSSVCWFSNNLTVWRTVSPDGYTWSGGLAQTMCDQICGRICLMQRKKPKLDNARHLRGIFFIEPNDEEVKLTMKAASKKVGSSDASSNALQNTDKEQWRNPPHYWETQGTKYCVVDADESTRPRPEGAGHKPHQDHVASWGMNSVNTTPKMPWEYSEHICERMATGKSWMNCYSTTSKEKLRRKVIVQVGLKAEREHQWRRWRLHDTAHQRWLFTTCTLTSSSTECAHARVVLFLAHFIHTHIGSRWVLSAPSFHPSSWPSTWAFSLHLDLLHSLLPSFPPVLLPLPLLPRQRRAAAGAQQEDHGKTCATPLLTGVRAPTTSSTSPTGHEPNGHDHRRAQRLIGSLLLHDPVLGPGRGWPDIRRDAHWSIPRTSRSLRTRRRVSQSVVVVTVR